MVAGNRSWPAEAGHHRRAERLGQREQLAVGVRGLHTPARVQHGFVCRAQQLRRGLDLALIRPHREHAVDAGVQQPDVGLGGEHVRRQLQRHRPGPPRAQRADRGAHHGRHLFRPPGQRAPGGQRGQHAGLVGQLVRQAESGADEVRGHLPGQQQHRRGPAVRGGQAGERVQHPGARPDQAHPDPAGGAGVAVGHPGRGLLVPRGVAAQCPAGALDRLGGRRQQVVRHPGQLADPFREQLRDQGLAARHAHTRRPLVLGSHRQS